MIPEFVITGIDRVLLVEPEQYPERRTIFRNKLTAHELIFHFSGEATVYFGDQVLQTAPNTVRFLPQGDIHRYEVVRKTHGRCIDVFFHTDRPVSPEAFVCHVPEGSQLGALFGRLFTLWISREEGSYFECLSLLYRIFGLLQRNALQSPRYTSRIEPAVEYIRQHFLLETIRTEDLAQLCGISYSYLKKLFLQRFGLTPKQYGLQLKLQYACDLLRAGNYSVSQVAEQCGFKDVYFFSRQFKSHIGLSPTAFAQL
jgi:AraC-like DNA-binding protein